MSSKGVKVTNVVPDGERLLIFWRTLKSSSPLPCQKCKRALFEWFPPPLLEIDANRHQFGITEGILLKYVKKVAYLHAFTNFD
jgi:hypothetical protein